MKRLFFALSDCGSLFSFSMFFFSYCIANTLHLFPQIHTVTLVRCSQEMVALDTPTALTTGRQP